MVGLENYYHLTPDVLAQYDEVWVVMRFPRKEQKDKCIHVPALAPSKELWKQTQEWKDAGKWNPYTFEFEYAPRYISEITGDSTSLAAVAKLLEDARHGKDIGLACTCYHENLCHRAVLGGIIQSIAPDIECKARRDYRGFWATTRILLEG